MSALEVLTHQSFQALEEKQGAWAIRRLDAMLLELQDLDDFLTDYIDRHHRRSQERNKSISAY
jgi:hypothetical protein